MNATAASGVTKLTLSFLLSLLSDNNYPGPEAPVTSKHHWSYKGPEGPDSWHVHYKYCSGERQSPIDIVPLSCEYDPGLEPFILDHFDVTSARVGSCVLNVTNNGHAASVRVSGDDLTIRGGGLQGVYKTAEFHFHWGSTDEQGSEHAVDGHKFPLEMHVVNYAEKYGTIKQAMNKPDGLAVLGVMFQLSEQDNPDFAALDEALKHVHKAGEHNLVEQLVLRSLLPSDLSRYWRYNGSLTTPYCFESVIWTVFTEPQKISHSQLETLRSLLHEEGHEINDRGFHHTNTPSRLVDNWRPLQPLHGRRVTRSFPDAGSYMGLRAGFRQVPVRDTTDATAASDGLSTTAKPASALGVSSSPQGVDPILQHVTHPTTDHLSGNQIYANAAAPGNNNLLNNRVGPPSNFKMPMEPSDTKHVALAPSGTHPSMVTTRRTINSNNENSVHGFFPSGYSPNIQNVLFDTKHDPNKFMTSGANPIRAIGNGQPQSSDSQKNLQAPEGVNKVNPDPTAKPNADATEVVNSSSILSDSSSTVKSRPENGLTISVQTVVPLASTTFSPVDFHRPSLSIFREENQGRPDGMRQSKQPNYPQQLGPSVPSGNPVWHDRSYNDQDVRRPQEPHRYSPNSLYPNSQRDSPQSDQMSSEHLRSLLDKLAATNRINTRPSSSVHQQPSVYSSASSVGGTPEFSAPIRDRDGNLLMINRANGDVYVMRRAYGDSNQPSGNYYSQQQQHYPHHQQEQYQQSYNVISSANAKQYSPASPTVNRGTPREAPYSSSVFLPRLDRPVRISSPYYDRVTKLQRQSQIPTQPYPYPQHQPPQYQRPGYYRPSTDPRYLG